jgi:hypothetical protein
MTTCGEFLVKQLQAWGVDTVFGIPGVRTFELYHGLPGSAIRHVTPRHEQGAGFMADVDIYTPDFLTIALDHAHLQQLLRAAPADRPLIIEVNEAPPFAP